MLYRALSRLNRLMSRFSDRSGHTTRPLSPARKFRPTLELLDARIVPNAAPTFRWTDATGDNSFTDPANWTNTLTGQVATASPPQGSSLTFDGTVSNANCSGVHGFGHQGVLDFNSITLTNGYTGTMTFASNGTTGITVNNFTLASGAISQPTAGTDLTVLVNFSWTGGTLNSSTNLANVNIDGNGNISPANAGTVYLGSSLIFSGTAAAPTTTTQNPGTIVATNIGWGVVIGAYSTVTAQTYTQGDIIGITTQQAGAQQVLIQANGTLGVVGPGTYTNNLQVLSNGQFNITGQANVFLTAGDATHPAYSAGDGSQTRIENGSTLNVPYGPFSLTGQSTLYLVMNPNLPANQQTAKINGNMYFAGGTILFSAPIGIGDIPLVYGTLTVNGNVDWEGGTYMPSVDYTTAGLANQWIINGTLKSVQTDIIQPNPQRGQNPPPASNWQILQANTTAGTLPTVTGNQLTLGTYTLPNGKIGWKLSS